MKKGNELMGFIYYIIDFTFMNLKLTNIKIS